MLYVCLMSCSNCRWFHSQYTSDRFQGNVYRLCLMFLVLLHDHRLTDLGTFATRSLYLVFTALQDYVSLWIIRFREYRRCFKEALALGLGRQFCAELFLLSGTVTLSQFQCSCLHSEGSNEAEIVWDLALRAFQPKKNLWSTFCLLSSLSSYLRFHIKLIFLLL